MHWHVMVEEIDKTGRRVKRRGALATTAEAAREEASIEQSGASGRKATADPCNLNCFGRCLA